MSLEHFQNGIKDINLKQTISETYNEIYLREKKTKKDSFRKMIMCPVFNHVCVSSITCFS